MFVIAVLNLAFTSYASTPSPTISVVLKREKSVVEFEIRISEDSNIAALNFEATYDSDVLRYTSYETTKIYDSGINQINDTQEGKIVCAYISPMSVIKGGNFLILKFEANDTTNIGNDHFNLNIKEMVNTQGKTLDYQIQYIGFENHQGNNETSQNELSSSDNNTESSVANNDKGEVTEKENLKNEENIQKDKDNKNISNGEIEKSFVKNQSSQSKQGQGLKKWVWICSGGLVALIIVISLVKIIKRKEKKR